MYIKDVKHPNPWVKSIQPKSNCEETIRWTQAEGMQQPRLETV